MASWVIISILIPITGYYIELNETFCHSAGLTFDTAFTRFRQDFGFFLLPALVTLVLALDSYGISGKIRSYTGYLIIAGIAIGFVFGDMYSLVVLNQAILYTAVFGDVLIGSGALTGTYYLVKASSKA